MTVIINKKKKKQRRICEYIPCMMVAGYGLPGDVPRYCSVHKYVDMIPIAHANWNVALPAGVVVQLELDLQQHLGLN